MTGFSHPLSRVTGRRRLRQALRLTPPAVHP